MLVKVIPIGVGELFCNTVPNAADDGVIVNVGETPVPVRFTVVGVAEPSLVIVNELLMTPRTLGVRLAVNVRFPPTETFAGNSGKPDNENTPAFVGTVGVKELIAEICKTVLPVFVTVIVCCPVRPVVTLPNGGALTAMLVCDAIPFNVIVVGEFDALDATVIELEGVPATVGENRTVNGKVSPAAITSGCVNDGLLMMLNGAAGSLIAVIDSSFVLLFVMFAV